MISFLSMGGVGLKVINIALFFPQLDMPFMHLRFIQFFITTLWINELFLERTTGLKIYCNKKFGIIRMEKEIRKYASYEDYLDSLIIEDDQKYLSDSETARQLVSLGYR